MPRTDRRSLDRTDRRHLSRGGRRASDDHMTWEEEVLKRFPELRPKPKSPCCVSRRSKRR